MAGRSARRTILLASDVPYSRLLLKQSLEQQGCSVTPATGVGDALSKLPTKAFDLLVIDLASPESASEQLLLQTRVSGSTVPVILLVSMLDRDLLRRLSNVRPVGVLTKPLSVDSLRQLLPLAFTDHDQLLRRSIELGRFQAPGGAERSGGRNPAVEELVEEAKIDEQRLSKMFGSMPLMPHVVARILQLTGSEESTVKQFSDVISGDPRLCGQLLRIVNSAYFGFARRIATIPEATVILGVESIRKLTLGAAVSNFFGGRSKLVDRMRLWRHSLAVAIASRKVAERGGLRNTEEAFTAGLLHDFGRLALERHLTPWFARALTVSREQGLPLLDAEEQTIGFSHAWLSGWLAGKWNLPAVLREAMAWHHHPERAAENERQVAAAVHAGNVLCHLGEMGGLEEVPPTITASPYATGLLNLDLEEAKALLPDIQAEATALEQQLAVAMSSDA